MRILPSCLITLVLSLAVFSEPNSSAFDLQSIVNKANSHLSTGQFNDAVRAYSEAIDHSPLDYILYYKRATAYYSLAKHQNALQDFEKVLDLTNGNFDKALLMQGRVHLREGDWAAAQKALKKYISRVKGDTVAGDLLLEATEGQAVAKRAVRSSKNGQYQACYEEATEALKVASYSDELRELRANCALANGDVQQAVGDLIRLTQIRPASTPLFLRIAQLSYFILPPTSQAQTILKQCLHFDPDSAPCAKLHRKLKAFDKSFSKLSSLREAGNWRGIVNLLYGTSSKEANPGAAFAAEFEAELKSIEFPSSVTPLRVSERRKDIYRAMCQAYVKLDQPKRAEWWCNELLQFKDNENDVDGLVGKGEAALSNEQWEEAVRNLEKAFEASGRSQEIMVKLQKAQRLLKQSKQKDYYKVLGVSRDADERTIKKAYRKAAKTAHPDKGGSEDKMAAVNEAYEVLSNPELRARFDNGDDPNDPTGQTGGGHPFQQGAHPFAQFFQGGPGGFQFQSGGMPFQFHYSSGGRH